MDDLHPLEIAAGGVRTADDFEGLVRPLLDALQQASGYESTYLTVIHFDEAKQEILFANNSGTLQITEGMLVEWSDTLCRRALVADVRTVVDASASFRDSDAASEMGIRGYSSVPIALADGTMVGTLCGASGRPVTRDDAAIELFAIFAVLMSEALSRERLLAHARERAAAAEIRLRTRLTQLAASEHVLKTPLTVLRGYAQMLASDRQLTPEQRSEALEAITTSVDSLRALVDEMLTATRADYKLESSLHRQVLDLSNPLSSLVAGIRAASPQHDWQVNIGSPLIARTDRAAVEQIVGHLLDNAVKYAPNATISVVATVVENEVVIEVSDTGPGIPIDTDPFAPFDRGDSGEDGVGIGLHIVKTLADALDGTVTHAPGSVSDGGGGAGGGTTFTIRLPQP